MMLKDFSCKYCGTETPDVEVRGSSVCALTFFCCKCECNTPHEAMCNGGLKSRYRFHDHEDYRDSRKRCKVLKVGACKAHEDGSLDYANPIREGNGEIVGDRPKFSDEARQDRREKVYHKMDKARGHGKIISTARAA